MISPSFLVRVIGKNPRPICNLSSNGNNGVNQMMDEFEANADGYTTIPHIAKLVVQSYVDMVLNPDAYGIDDVSCIDLSMLVADAADAFTRVSVSPEVVGMQATRVAGITIYCAHVLPVWMEAISRSIFACHSINTSHLQVKFGFCNFLEEGFGSRIYGKWIFFAARKMEGTDYR